MTSEMTRRDFGSLASLAAAASLAAPAASHAQMPTGQPIRIGSSMSLSGGLAGNGRPSLLAQQIWIEDVNAKGGLLGRPVQLVHYDDQSAGAQVPGIYTKLLDVDKVDLVVSGYSTAIIAPAMPVVMQRGAAFVTLLGSGTNDRFRYGRCANVSPNGARMHETFAEGFFEIVRRIDPRPKSVAIAGLDSDFTQKAMQSARFEAKAAGVAIVYDRAYPPSTVDFSPVVRAIQAARPEVVFFASYPPDSVGLLKAVVELKLTASLLGGGMIGPQVTAIKEQLGPILNNLVCWDTYVPEPTLNFPGVGAFLERYRKAAEAQRVETLGHFAPPLAYAQMQVLEQAVTRVGKIDQAAIGADLRTSEFSTIIGKLSFDELGELRQARHLYVQYQGISGNGLDQFKKAGTQVVLYPEQYRSGQLRTPFPAS